MIETLLAGLERLDLRLAAALDAKGAAAADPFRGLYLTADDVRGELAEQPGAPRLWCPWLDNDPVSADRLMRAFCLDAFEVDVLVLALAPEIDVRYGRCFAYLQDDVSSRRPTVALALDLLTSSVGERLARRQRFDPGAPLIAHGVLELAEEPGPLLDQAFSAVPALARRLLGATADPRVRSVNTEGALELLDGDTRAALQRIARRPLPLSVRLSGPPSAAREAAAAVLADHLGRPLLHAGAEDLSAIALIDARLDGAVLFITGGPPPSRLAPEDVIVAEAGGELTLELPAPGTEQRRAAWTRALRAVDASRPAADIDALASRFRIGSPAIAAAAADAHDAALLRGPRARVSREDVFAAARRHSSGGLAALATRVEPRRRWGELVLPSSTLAKLREICDRVAAREHVLDTWGFDRRLSLGKGVGVLFGGASGTGKTLAAQMLAGELGLELYRVDLAGVVSKYIGETEKNLERIFSAAADCGAIVFFDEAEALFGKRSEVSDAHDRYANIEVAYLLQRMEAYDGVAILATNLRQQLDDAFLRRLVATVHFPFPDEAARRRIWAGIWPAEAELDADVDPALLAARFRITGGAIRNAALTAAFRAAAAGRTIALADVLHGVQRELEKVGKTLTPAELHGSAPGLETAA